MLALVLHLAPTGYPTGSGEDAPGHAVLAARRGARWLWMLAVLAITTHETVPARGKAGSRGCSVAIGSCVARCVRFLEAAQA